MTSSYNAHVHPFNVTIVPTPDESEASESATDEPRAIDVSTPESRSAKVPTNNASQHESASPATHETPDAHAAPATWPPRDQQDAALPPAPEPTAEQKQAIELVSRLTLVAQETKAALNEKLAEFDLNDIRYSVLSIVREAAAEGCSQSMLAQKLRQSESSISTLVDRMRTSGLLYRLRSKTDRRKRYLTLTERGRQLLGAVDSRYGECVDGVLSSLGREDRSILASLLQRLLLRLEGETETTVHTPAA